MNINASLEHLDKARRSHIKWLNRAKSIIDGKSLVRDPHPLESTACQFGLWFNSEGEVLFNMLKINGIDTIHTLHNQLHEKYLTIYEIYFGSAEGIIYDSKVKLQKNTISITEEEKAREHFAELRKLSYLMLGEIEKLQTVLEDNHK
jgi:hypothetical protein